MNKLKKIFVLLIAGLLIGCVDSSEKYNILIEELTDGEFDDSVTFYKDNTFLFDVNDDLKISGNYSIHFDSCNEFTDGSKHLYMRLKFSNVKNSSYWDEDNDMEFRFYESDNRFMIRGTTKNFPIVLEKFISTSKGNNLINAFCSDRSASKNEEITKTTLPEVDKLAVELINDVEVEISSPVEVNNENRLYETEAVVEYIEMYDGNYGLSCKDSNGENITLYIKTFLTPDSFSSVSLNTDGLEGKTVKAKFKKRNWMENYANLDEPSECNMLVSIEIQ